LQVYTSIAINVERKKVLNSYFAFSLKTLFLQNSQVANKKKKRKSDQKASE